VDVAILVRWALALGVSGIDRRTSCFRGCSCLDERLKAAVVMAVLVRWALAHLVGAALADALPGSLAAPAWMSAAVEVVSWYGEHWRT
jgi:hypothetical protein